MLAYLPLISSATHKLKLPLMLQVGEIVGSSFMVGLIVGFCVGTGVGLNGVFAEGY